MHGILTGPTAPVTGSVQGIGLAGAGALAGARIAVHGLADAAQEAGAGARGRCGSSMPVSATPTPSTR